MAFDKEISPRWRLIREVLNTDWDPISAGCPEDEYDSYIPKIVALLQFGASDVELVAYLREVETIDMCLSAQPDAQLQKVVDRLRALGSTDETAR